MQIKKKNHQWSGRDDVVKILIDNGADVNARDTNDGNTPFSLALKKGKIEFEQMFPFFLKENVKKNHSKFH